MVSNWSQHLVTCADFILRHRSPLCCWASAPQFVLGYKSALRTFVF